LDGYRLALASAGIALDPALELWGDFTESGTEDAAEHFLKSGVTAVFCACDATAIGLVRSIKARGKKVPRDFSVVGYDDSPLSAAVSPALTTVAQDFYRIGQVACGMMQALLQGLPLHCETVMPKLVVRDSTGPAPD
ncbi:MAG: LacI family DNA-binding transcriptional regulator, partial [Bacillota bacterium]